MKNSLLTLTFLFLISPIFNSLLAQPITFERHTISSISTSIRAHVADLDGDNDQDIITAEAVGDGKLYWWESSGGANPTFTKHQFGSNFAQSNDFTAADINGDGHMDIVSSSFTLQQLAWWKNDGNPNPSFTKQLLSNNISQAQKAIPVDIDNDTDIDIIVLGRGAGKVFIFKNDGNLNPSFSQSSLSILTGSRGIAVGYINSDNLIDIVVGESFPRIKIFYGSNSASSGFTSTFVNGPQAEQVWVADMNSDGQKDILMLFTFHDIIERVGYLKNSGGLNPTFSLEFINNYNNAFRIEPANIDNNVAMDILGGSNWDDSFRWWENGGGGAPSFTNRLIDGPFSSAWTVTAGDMDNDGDQDVVATNGNKLYWYENDLIEACEISITCKDPFNFPITQNGGTSVISGSDMVRDHLTEDCGSNLDFTINGQQLLDFFCDDIGPQLLTIVATDESGNSTSCTIPITVVDIIPPAITCPGDQSDFFNQFCEFEIPDYRDLASVVDNCSNIIIQTPGPGTVVDGNRTMILTAVDNEGQTNTCTFDLTLSDDISPIIVCPPAQSDFFDSNCQFSIPDYTDLIYHVSDGCGLPTVTQSLEVGTIIVGNTTVTLTATDGSGNTSFCRFDLTLSDDTDPSIICPPGFSQTNDEGDCRAVVDVPSAIASDNCGVTFLKARTREVDENGDAISGWSGFANDPDGFYPVGRWEVQWRAKDAANNKKNCKFIFEVTDDEGPTPVCLDPTVTFNGEATINLNLADVYDAGASSDNCTDVIVNTFFPTSVSCEELGSIIPVTVSVSDENGNGTSCTAFVTVDGLPCGWMANPDGIGCPDGNDPSYDPVSGNFMISSEGCYDPAYYSNSDSQGFASSTLCGDGEIIAQVTQVSGNGWGGVSMRESLSAGAKMLQLSIDGVSLTKRELRQSTGGLAFNHLFQTQGNIWLRLTRSGNQFTAQQSSDGTNWATVIITNIPMSNCIQVGLITENKTASGDATATFSNVEIKGGIAPLSAPEVPGDIAEGPSVEPKINLYPNPAKDEAWIDLGNHFDQVQAIDIYNNLGQLVENIPASAIGQGLIRLTTNTWDNGLYLVRITIDEQTVVTRRLVRN